MTLYASATRQARIDGWLAEIAKLPPRKQKNWKGILYDKSLPELKKVTPGELFRTACY